jgi:hypothetical protein
MARLVEFVELHEERAACGDVHLGRGPLEGRAVGFGPESVHDVLLERLVDQHEVHLQQGQGQSQVKGHFTSVPNSDSQKSISGNVPATRSRSKSIKVRLKVILQGA